MPKGHEKDISKTSPNIDQIKDTKDISNILYILDSHPIKTNPFGANLTGDNSYRRAERLSAALHLITNHVPNDEPLRVTIREGGLALLSLILEMRSGFRAQGSEKGQAALAAIRQLVSHVRLLAVSGYLSPSNASAVSEALDELGSLIVASQRSALSEQLTISRDDLVPPAREQAVFSRNERTESPRTYTRRTQSAPTTESSSTSTRAEQIMDILKLGGTLGIKDISANLPQYSEKMVQRELAALTDSGRVKKMGAKRWSKYQAVQ
jgi:hypothetical protein